jgi:hypothetical protein
MATTGRDHEHQAGVDLGHGHDADVLGVGGDARAAAGAGNHGRDAVGEEGAADVRIQVAAGHRGDGLDVAEVLGHEDDRDRDDEGDGVAVELRGVRAGQPSSGALVSS